LKRRNWYIEQCDHCVFFRPLRYCSSGEGYNLNLDKEINKKCNDFQFHFKLSERQLYFKLLINYFKNKKLSYIDAKQQYYQIKSEDRRDKCIELGLITDNDFKFVYGLDFQDISLIEKDNPRLLEEYLLWHREVLRRDNFQCQICHSNKGLQVHHLDSFAKYQELRHNVDNGITLCEQHHDIKFSGSFHNLYGTKNFTKNDFFEYKNNQIECKQIIK
jgi:hypothetical protein